MRSFLIIIITLLIVGCSSEDKTINEKNKEIVQIEDIDSKDTFDDKFTDEILFEEKIVKKEQDGKSLYRSCSSCHGEKAEQEALGVSKPINSFTKEQLLLIFNGYIDGTYGSSFKTIMKPHLETKSKEELELLAEYISTLE